jgi:hypothetical protein
MAASGSLSAGTPGGSRTNANERYAPPTSTVPNRNTTPKSVGNGRSEANTHRSTSPESSASTPPIALRNTQNVPKR